MSATKSSRSPRPRSKKRTLAVTTSPNRPAQLREFKIHYSGEEIIAQACPANQPGGIITRPGYYSNRGVNRGDLHENHLEKIHAFIKTKIGEEEAKAFVLFVHRLDDLNATAFLMAFYHFVNSGFHPTPNKALYLTSHEDAQGHAIGLMGHIAGKENPFSKDSQKMASITLKTPFIFAHKSELPKSEQQTKQAFFGPYGQIMYLNG